MLKNNNDKIETTEAIKRKYMGKNVKFKTQGFLFPRLGFKLSHASFTVLLKLRQAAVLVILDKIMEETTNSGSNQILKKY